jgi:glyoxylate reductase
MKSKILVSGHIEETVLRRLDDACSMLCNREDRPMDRERVLEAVADREGFLSMITDRVDAELMDRAPRLRVVANMAVGYNNVDVEAASARGILVTNTPGVVTEPTADLTFALLLAVGRPRAGEFRWWAPRLFLSTDISGKTLGIVGLGRIGKAVAERARGFRMRILYFNRRRLEPAEERSLGVTYREFGALLGESDFVSLHVPLTDETRHLINRETLSQMKPTAFLLNVSRGPVVDERALVEALRQRKLAGAGLDVYENEPALEPGLAELDHVVLLPHVGSATIDVRARMAEMAAGNLLAALKGDVPPNLVNPDALKRRRS